MNHLGKACHHDRSGANALGDIKSSQRREVQLDAISTVLILAMVALLGLLMYFLTVNDVQLPSAVLTAYAPRILLGGFVIIVVLYLTDQRRRLREQIAESIAETETARSQLAAANRWLAFSHDAASTLGSLGTEKGLTEILTEAADLFRADGAAVIGDEREWSFIGEGVPADVAQRTMMHVAMVAAGRSAPLNIQSLGTEPGQAIAVPLRVEDELRYVLAVWRRER